MDNSQGRQHRALSLKATSRLTNPEQRPGLHHNARVRRHWWVSEENEVRVLDWREELHSSTLFGPALTGPLGKSIGCCRPRREALALVLEPRLSGRREPGGDNYLYDLVVHQTNGWVMEQIWGFGMLNDERWLMRTMVVRKATRWPLPSHL